MASLHVAVLFGNEELTRKLLEEGYDANVYDERLGTPLSIAILKGYRSIVKLLSDNGADHNNEGFTSALINSRIDEFNLPNTFSPSNADNGSRPQDSKSQEHSSQTVADDRKIERDNKIDSSSNTGPGMVRGSISEIKILFKKGSKWTEAPADEEPLQLAKRVYESYAVVQYMDSSNDGGWQISRIAIHGSKLCGFLSQVLKNYPGTGIGQSRATLYNTPETSLDPNFVGLFHRIDRYVKLCEEEVDPVIEEQANLLLQILKTLWGPFQNAIEDSRTTGGMRWSYLWVVFQPGNTVVIDRDGNELSAARVLEVRANKSWDSPLRYEVAVEVVDWNGSYSGYRKEVYGIAKYDGFKKLVDLVIYPLSYHPEPSKLRERLVQRGRKFESLRGYFFMARKSFNVTRRVIIDNYAYHRFQGDRVPPYARLGGQSSISDNGSEHTGYTEDAIQELALWPSRTERVRMIHRERNEDLRPLTDNECLLCVATMKGFDVQEKKWNDIHIDSLESVTWDDEAFNHLTIQEDRKRLVLAFTKQKQIEVTEFDDVITGKGKSFIFLLCGPPGVGKTLTAESVAEHTRSPLYTLSAGDLGTNAKSVEKSLKKALEICGLWKAVMLIDEADVFLEARKTDNLERNEIVSVFLRLLEYYKGILFLTTNRVATIDAAFESRIDLIIPYDDFDQAARRQVWANFADRLVGGTHELCDADFHELSQQKLNGREIKSIIKTGLMLANSEGKKLQMEHLKVVLDVRQQATAYLHPESLI
ncbi:hypothetical protein F4679DRAFT_378080 [Xylaria curta]|nr:hypothetical protein F4679DRAFT_378080 [Xylaria curta]